MTLFIYYKDNNKKKNDLQKKTSIFKWKYFFFN